MAKTKITCTFVEVKDGQECVSLTTGVKYRKGSSKEGYNAQTVPDGRDVKINAATKVEVISDSVEQ